MTEATTTPVKKRRLLSRFMNYAAFGIIVVLFLIALLWRSIFITIPPGSVGVHWLRFFNGTQLDTYFGEGTKIIFPWDRVYVYDTRLKRIDATVVALSAEGLEISTQVNVLYEVQPEQAPYLHANVGPDFESQFVIPVVATAVREQIAVAVDLSDLSSDLTSGIETSILESIQTKLDTSSTRMVDGESYVHVIDFNIAQMKLPVSVNAAIEAKEAAKQSLFRYKYTLEEAQLEAQRREIEAQGIRKFQEIVTPAISDSFLRWRGIEATLALAQSPNSKIVVIGGSDGLPLILDGRTDTPVDTSAAAAAAAGATSAAPMMNPSYWNRLFDNSLTFTPSYKDGNVPHGLPVPKPKVDAMAEPGGEDPAKTPVAKP